MKRWRVIGLAVIVILLALLITGVILLTMRDPVLIASAPANISASDTFSVDVSIKHNRGIAVFIIDLKYDETAFEFVSVEDGSLFDSKLDMRDRDFKEYHAVRTMFSELDPFHADGVLYTVNLKAKPDIVPGDYDFELAYTTGNIVETPGIQVNPDVVNTSVTVR